MKKHIWSILFCIYTQSSIAEFKDIYIISSSETQYLNDKIICTGNVIIEMHNKLISADKISYDKINKMFSAIGNITITDEKNNIYQMDSAEIKNDFSIGRAKNIKIILTDKSRLAAETCTIKNEIFRLRNVIYTSCYECNKSNELTWQLKSSTIIFDPKKNLEFKNITIESFGKPVFGLPYLSRPNPSIKKKSGFLRPDLSISNQAGIALSPKYYVSISPTQELIFKPIITSKIGSAFWGYYGNRFKNGEFNIDASITGTKSIQNYSKDILTNNEDIKKIKNKGFRGHVFSKGRLELNDIWKIGFDINWASDRFYLRKFPFIKYQDRILESNVLIEGFDGRNYTVAKMASFQNVSKSIAENENITPTILPVIERNISKQLAGGTLDIDIMAMSLSFKKRSAQKILNTISWSKIFKTAKGSFLNVKSSISIKGINVSESKQDKINYESNFQAIPQLSLIWNWPLISHIRNKSLIMTPYFGGIFADNLKFQDILEDPFSEINDINFMESSRAMSPYNTDNGSRIIYGLKASLYGKSKTIGHFTIGRSTEIRKSKKDIFYATGLNKKHSNIVISTDLYINDSITSFIKGSYSSKKHSWLRLEGGFNFKSEKFDCDFFGFNGNQCYFNPFDIEDIPSKTDQKTQKYKGISLNTTVKVNKKFHIHSGIILGHSNSQLMKYNFGISYKNECSQIEIMLERNNHKDIDIEPETRIKLEVKLKGF